MNGEVELVASFGDQRACARAIRMLREASLADFRVFAPVPSEEITEAIGKGRSRVRGWVLAGGITGALSGFALTIGTSLEWNLIVGGKPVVSIPPFIIIAFELMILFGGISAVIGFLVNSRMPAFEAFSGYSSRFGADKFGLLVRCGRSDRGRAEALLTEAGAQEVAGDAG